MVENQEDQVLDDMETSEMLEDLHRMLLPMFS